MKNFKRFLCAICVFVTVLGAPLSVMAANEGPSSHCASSSYQVTGGYTYKGSSSHMYWFKVCNYSYKKDFTYRRCILCGQTGTFSGSNYDENHQLH